jgi:S1-C subfamily serine protease
MKRVIFQVQIVILLFLVVTPSARASESAVSKISAIENTIVAICHTEPSLYNRIGTGFIASPEGVVVTADHVIHDRSGKLYNRIFCLRPNYPRYEKYELILLERLRRGQRGRDIAILKIRAEKHQGAFPFLSISENLEIGQSVLVPGFPNIFKAIYLWPLFKKGTVSSIRYKYEESDIIILDMKSLEGYSGAPVIEERSLKIIGVLKGKNVKRAHGDFSVATPISKADIQINDKR